jgi:hypothetical protein
MLMFLSIYMILGILSMTALLLSSEHKRILDGASNRDIAYYLAHATFVWPFIVVYFARQYYLKYKKGSFN